MSDEGKARELAGMLAIFWDCIKKKLENELVIAEYHGRKNQIKAIKANLQVYKYSYKQIRHLIQQQPEIDEMYVNKKINETMRSLSHLSNVMSSVYYKEIKKNVDKLIRQIIKDVQGREREFAELVKDALEKEEI